MNKLTIYVLPIWWGCIRRIKKFLLKYNLKYLLMPIIYLIIIFDLGNLKVVEQQIAMDNEVIRMDSYNEIILTDDLKKTEILQKYHLSDHEFDVVCAITLAEAEHDSYDDAYAVINTIYNRTKSNRWIKSVDKKFGKGRGESLYYQAISPRQFTVYASGSYKKYLGVTDSNGYKAIIDFLYSEELLHNYLSFRSHNIKVDGSVSFSEKGNNYFNEI